MTLNIPAAWPELPQPPAHLSLRKALLAQHHADDEMRCHYATRDIEDNDKHWKAYRDLWMYLVMRRDRVKPRPFAEAFAQANPQLDGYVSVMYRTPSTQGGMRTRPDSVRHYTIRDGRVRRTHRNPPKDSSQVAIIDLRAVMFGFTDTPTVSPPRRES